MIEAVPVTKLEKDLKFPTLDIRFSDSAARLEDLKKTSVSGVRIEPKIAGVWSWNSDKELMFRPTEDWPADQNFKIIFDKKFFSPLVLMERLAFEFRTPPFEIAIKDVELYQDPTNPTQRQATATLELTHAVEPGELDRHLQLLMIGGSAVFPQSDPAPHFTLSYGLHRRIAYLRSSNVTLPDKEDFMKLELSKGVRTAQGGAQTRDAAEQKLLIPSNGTAFQIKSIEGTIARKKRKIDNMFLRYVSNRKASSTFAYQKECALSVIILWRRITTPSLQYRSFHAKCKLKVKAACWRSVATGNCRSVHALCGRSNLKLRALLQPKSTISLVRLKASSRTRSSVRRCISTKKTSLASRLSSSRSQWITNGRPIIRLSIFPSTCGSRQMEGASVAFSS